MIKDLVPSMTKRLQSHEHIVHRRIRSKGGLTDEEMDSESAFDTTFKQLFCLAAQELADQLDVPLTDLGILYDDILVGNFQASVLSRLLGKGAWTARKGQRLFTVKLVDKLETCRLEASGYRFAPIEHVAPTLSCGIHVPSVSLDSHIRDMRNYAVTERGFEPGTHLVSFVMRPTVQDNFEILTVRGVGNPLPSVTLPVKCMKASHMRVFSRMNGWTVPTCVSWLPTDCAANAYAEHDDFRDTLRQAIEELTACLPSDISSALQFVSRPLTASARDANATPCAILAFCAITNLDTQVSNPDYVFTPFNIFRAEQQMHQEGVGREQFGRELSKELCLSHSSPPMTPLSTSSNSMANSLVRFLPSKNLRELAVPNGMKTSSSGSSISEESLVEPAAEPYPLRDITVSKEVRVDVTDVDDALAQSLQKQESRTVVAAGDTASSSSTYVDELYSLLCSPGARYLPDSIFQGTADQIPAVK